jgi:outer membrane lipoprotein-sorting protein
MKKLTFLLTALFLTAAINAQTLEEIVKNYSAAIRQDKVSALSTIKISGKMSMMGMEMPMTLFMKNPDKIKVVTSFNGQDIIQVFDGVKGYTMNPMATGSSDPVEMTPEDIKQTQNSNMFRNYMAVYLKNGQLSLEGQENVNDKPAFKIKANLDGGNFVYMFIDKESYLIAKTTATVNQGGTTITVDSYPTEYTDFSGILIPAKTTTSASGMEFMMVFDKVEVNVPIADSLFSVK